MALTKINTMTEAMSIGPKKTDKRMVEGFLTGARYNVGKTAKKKGNTLFHFQNVKGETFDVWGNASVSGALLTDGKVNPAHVGTFIRVQFTHMRPAGKGKNPQKVCDVFADSTKKISKKFLATGGQTEYRIK